MRKLYFLIILFCFHLFLNAAIINVPSKYSTIEDALKRSAEGDTIIIAPGTYIIPKSLNLNKSITIASNYIVTKANNAIDKTIIAPGSDDMHEWFEISAKNAKVIGIKFIGNKNHTLNITAQYAFVEHCKFINGKDQLSFSGGGGYVGYCYFENAGDDALDCDQSIAWIIEHNIIVNAHQDGIEIRLHNKKWPLTKHYFRYNTVSGSGESGIQLIDYKGNSFREFYINNNVFQNCRGAGVSCMYQEKDNTSEVYRGSLMQETAFVYNNTFADCNFGITISPGLLIINNIFVNSKTKAIERGIYVDDNNDRSMVDYSIFFNNKNNYDKNVSVGSDNLIDVNPLLENYITLMAGSPCIDKGIADYNWKGKKLIIPQSDYSGKKPDLGAFEFGLSNINMKIPVISAGNDTILIYPDNKMYCNGSINKEISAERMHFTWSKVNGPGLIEFSDPIKLQTTVFFSKQGIYKIKLTGTDSLITISDEITIHFVKDFKDKTVVVGKNNDVFIEAEDYRYLIGSAEIVPLAEEKGAALLSHSDEACAIYEVSTKDEATFYIWVRFAAKDDALTVSFNDTQNVKFVSDPVINQSHKYEWQKIKIQKIPEGIYPLIIKANSPKVSWDKLFITYDAKREPMK